MTFQQIVSAAILLILTAACATTPRQNLFTALGGEQGVVRLVDHMIESIGDDKQIFHYFADTKISRFRQKLYLHLCQVSDGPCHYDGDSMIDVHTGMNINEGDFNHLVEILIAAMDQEKLTQSTQNKLLKKLAPLRSEIIYQ